MAAAVEGARSLVVVGQAGRLAGQAVQLLPVDLAIQVAAKALRAADDVRVFQQVRDAVHAGLCELQPQVLAGFGGKVQFEARLFRAWFMENSLAVATQAA